MYSVLIQDEFGQLVKARQRFMTEREACKIDRQKGGDGYNISNIVTLFLVGCNFFLLEKINRCNGGKK